MNDDDMSNTFVGEVGQKSAIFKEDEDIETIDDGEIIEEKQEELFPEVKIDPPSEIPDTLKNEEEKKENEHSKTKEEDKVDDEFLEDIKSQKPKKDKKGHPFLTFLLMLICIALGAGASYYYFEIYNKPVEKPKKKEKTEEKIVQLQPSSRFVNELVNSYVNDFDPIESYVELYSKDSMTVADFSNEYTQKLGALNLKNTTTFKNEELQNSLDKLFGANKTQVEKEDIEYSKCYLFEYKEEEYTLSTSDTCKTLKDYELYTKVVKAEKDTTKNELYVNVSVALTDGNKMYKSYDVETKEGKEEIVDLTYSSFDMDKDYTKFNQYKYTYKYEEENNDYYLVGIELNK